MTSEHGQTLAEHDRLAVIGLVTLAARANAEHDRLRAAIGELVGEPADDYGYRGRTDDLVNEATLGADHGADVDRMLGLLAEDRARAEP